MCSTYRKKREKGDDGDENKCKEHIKGKSRSC